MSVNENRPMNIAANVVSARFVVSVDRQAKSSFADVQDAQREADRISASYPRVVVHVSDRTRELVQESSNIAPVDGDHDA